MKTDRPAYPIRGDPRRGNGGPGPPFEKKTENRKEREHLFSKIKPEKILAALLALSVSVMMLSIPVYADGDDENHAISDETAEQESENNSSTTAQHDPQTEVPLPDSVSDPPDSDDSSAAPQQQDAGGAQEVANVDAAEESEVTLPEQEAKPAMEEEQVQEEADLTPYITGGTIYYKTANDADWIIAKPNQNGTYNVPDDADYEIGINYRIPQNALNTDRHILTYQLPRGIRVYPESGPILQGSTLMGSFSIEEDGKVTLDFNQEAIDLNSSGPMEDGMIRYNVDLDQAENRDDNHNVSVDLGSVHLVVHFTVNPDLSIEKKGVSEKHDRRVDYTITVVSKNGTKDEPVSITDERLEGSDGQISLDEAREIRVFNADGQEISGWKLEKTEHGFVIENLPPLKAGQKYTVTYHANVKVTNGRSVEAVNQASASSGEIHTSPSKVIYRYEPKGLISKMGEQTEDGRLSWTIVINQDHDDLSGWRLEDVFNDSQITDTVEISPAIDGQNTIQLPYTFPKGSTDTYEITYETPAAPLAGSDRAINGAYLYPPDDGKPAQSTAQVTLSEHGVEEVRKSFVRAEKGADQIEILTWNLKIQAGQEGFGSLFMLNDSCGQKEMYFTKAELDSIYQQMSEQLQPYGITIIMMMATEQDGAMAVYPDFEAGARYQTFSMEMSSGLQNDQSVDLTYQTTVDTAKLTRDTDFPNAATVINQYGSIEKQASWRWKCRYPGLRKLDARDMRGGELTKHAYDDTDGGLLKWDLQLIIPEGNPGDETVITETVPDGLNLDHKADGSPITDPVIMKVWKSEFALPLDGIEKDGISATIVKTDGHERIRFVFSEEFFKKHPKLRSADIILSLGLDKEPEWKYDNGLASEKFENVAVMTCGKKIRETRKQTQEIFDRIEISGLTKEVSADNTGNNQFADNTIPYTITVNPKAEQLCGESEDLIIDDIASVPFNEKDPASLELVNGSVSIAEIKNGKQIPLSPDQYSYVFSSRNTGDGTMEYEIEFTVPDRMSLQISYDYLVNGKIGSEYTISNTASLACKRMGHMNDHTDTKARIISAQATVEEIGVSVYKTDIDNSMTLLPDAKFELEEYNPSTQYFEPVLENGKPKLFTTNEFGEVCLSAPWISFGKAYLLKEVKAPEGYIASDEEVPFIVLDGSEQTSDLPEGFMKKASVFNMCGNLYVGNKKASRDIHVNKTWVDEKGDSCSPMQEAIEAGLYRKEKDGSWTLIEKAALSEENGWQASFDNLPVYGEKTVDGKKTWDLSDRLEYTVREMTESPLWSASVTQSDESEFTLENRKKPTPIHLPQTGSSGWMFLLPGALLLIFTGYYLSLEKRET